MHMAKDNEFRNRVKNTKKYRSVLLRVMTHIAVKFVRILYNNKKAWKWNKTKQNCNDIDGRKKHKFS